MSFNYDTWKTSWSPSSRDVWRGSWGTSTPPVLIPSAVISFALQFDYIQVMPVLFTRIQSQPQQFQYVQIQDLEFTRR